MNQHMEGVFALIGRYIVASIIVADILIIKDIDVPFWCAFPLTTIWMILRGQLGGAPEVRAHTRDKDRDIDESI